VVDVVKAIRAYFFFVVFFCVTFLQTSVTRLPEMTVILFEPTRVQFCPTDTVEQREQLKETQNYSYGHELVPLAQASHSS